MSKTRRNRVKSFKEWDEKKAEYHEEGQYFNFPMSLWKLKLFHLLPTSARIVYIEFRARCFKSRESIPLTYKEAQSLGLSHKVFKSAINILAYNGFIKRVPQIVSKEYMPSMFSLSSEWFEKNSEYVTNSGKYLSEYFPNKLKHRAIMKKANTIRLEKNKSVIPQVNSMSAGIYMAMIVLSLLK
ncbi:hypothetical protein A2223_00050 [Candidatus Falkowbacteria bacterium RIFOXYA2_FULL_35_8]|nr:MAG: hypothetical protein A2223_00050 [Candidatus Falkowbacteria bacterium RIFOXYA2_FULL_35_8]